MYPTQSVPAVVHKAYWKGAHSVSNTLLNCFSSVLATRCLREPPVAMPLTPPSGFVRAVILALNRASTVSLGTLACDKLSQTDRSHSNVSVSSNIPFKCSYVHPPGPGEDSHRTGTSIDDFLRQWCNWDLRTFPLHVLESGVVPWGHRCPRQTLADWRALDTSPILTRCSAALPFCSIVMVVYFRIGEGVSNSAFL